MLETDAHDQYAFVLEGRKETVFPVHRTNNDEVSLMILDMDDLKSLLENQNSFSVTIYMPTHRSGKDTEQGPIRFRNLISNAERELAAAGITPSDIQKLFKPVHPLIENHDFWQHQDDGLAVFIARGIFKYYRLPVSFTESVTINNRFFLKPLLRLFAGNGQYYALWLSKGRVRVFDGSHYGLSEIAVPDLPESMDHALQYDDSRQQLPHQSRVSNRSGDSKPPMFHGHGAPQDTEKNDIVKYFRIIDKILHPLLNKGNVPLILCGVEYLHALYREANTHPYLMDKAVMANPKDVTELHRMSWEIMNEYFVGEWDKSIDLYGKNTTTGLVSNDIREIVSAGVSGRIRDLFLDADATVWGAYDMKSNSVEIHDEHHPGDDDLLDLASVATLLRGGNVYAVARERVPDGGAVSAVYRY